MLSISRIRHDHAKVNEMSEHSKMVKPQKEAADNQPQQAALNRMDRSTLSAGTGNQTALGTQTPPTVQALQGQSLIDEFRGMFGQADRVKEMRQAAPRPSSGGTPLDDTMRTRFERRFGLSMDDVRVYHNSPKPAELGALAYAKGTDIFVGPGQERHLEHELGHVVQQKFGQVQPTMTIDGLPVNMDQALEHGADTLSISGNQAEQGDSVVQMVLPHMRHQLGSDCGFHALARAISKLTGAKEEVGLNSEEHLEKRQKLEKELASHAVAQGYSVIGEAFDPEALVRTCNELYGKGPVPLRAESVDFEGDNLQDIIKSAGEKNQIILLPYFPGEGMAPIENKSEENAHWAAIDPQDYDTEGDTIPIYEGNRLGIGDKGGPASYKPGELQASNSSIKDTFNWEKFIDNTDVVSFMDGYMKFRNSDNEEIEALKKEAQDITQRTLNSQTQPSTGPETPDHVEQAVRDCINQIVDNQPEISVVAILDFLAERFKSNPEIISAIQKQRDGLKKAHETIRGRLKKIVSQKVHAKVGTLGNDSSPCGGTNETVKLRGKVVLISRNT